MKKKGFTLLELLAVIIILAVIALITTPIVLNVVDEAKKSAFQDSTYGLIKSGEYYYTSQILNGGMTSDKVFNFPNNTELEFSGTEPESGYIKVTKEGLVEIAVSNGKYCATKGLNEDKVTIKDYVEGECTVSGKLQAPTISLNGDILNITPNDDRTEKYEIYVDGELKTTIAAQQAAAAGVAEVGEENVIKAGTYRFNDVPVLAGEVPLEQAVNFTAKQFFVLTEETMGFPPGEYMVTYHFDHMRFGHNGGTDDPITPENIYGFWHYNKMTSGANVIEQSEGMYAYDYSASGWAYLFQTITIPSDTEVSAEFYNWFTANAVEQKEISGKWKVNESFTIPNVETELSQFVNFVTYWDTEGTKVKIICDELVAINDAGIGAYLRYGLVSSEPDMSSQYPYEYIRSEYAESLRLIDFGTEPQYVSIDFYNWFIANAVPVEDEPAAEEVSFDLTTLNLGAGNHSITVKAVADGYEDSAESNAVTYVNGTSEPVEPEPTECQHANTTIINASATYTGDTYCNDCNTTIATGTSIEATATLYSDGTFIFSTNASLAEGYTENDVVATYAGKDGWMYDTYTSSNPAPWYSNISAIKRVVVEDGVAPMSTQCWFKNAINLKSAYIGTGVSLIGNSAFHSCTNLTDIIIAEGVTKIDQYAFYSCKNVENITLPASLTTIDYLGFSAGATNVYITDLAAWCNIDIYNESVNPLKGGYLHLNGELVTDLVVPDTVTTIGKYVFYYCKSLTSVTIPDHVISIGDSVFNGCSNLTTVTFGENSQLTTIGEYAFAGTNLTSVTIPDSVTAIVEGTFKGCTNLTSVTIPDSVTRIGMAAFYNCDSLTSITIPDSVTSIATYAFEGCTSLTSVTFGENSQLTVIAQDAFRDCTSLTSIVIPASVSGIYSYAFRDCAALTSVIFENPDGWWYASYVTATSGTAIDVSNPATAATYLKDTYASRYWKRS